MFYIYKFLVLILTIVLSPVIIIALIITPKFRAGFWQKLGFYKQSNINENQKHIVIHAVSVGEVIAVEKFIKSLRENFKNDKITITTVTKTGNAVAHQKLSNVVDEIIYFPFDLFFAVKSFIKNIKPDMVIVAETEIWPYFSKALNKKNIPLLIINGRISPHSYNGYKKFSWFFKPVLKNYSQILMQTKGDMERIVKIGAPDKITKVMGNLKFDITNNLSDADITNLKNEFKSEDFPVLIIGSTHKGEDEILLACYKKLLNKIPNLKIILAPRHPERLKEVENLIKTFNFTYSKRSEKGNFETSQIVLVDTMGELAKLYAISNIAFIGGSFSGTGGHNPLEASIYNVPVISGPSTFNFKDIYKFLSEDKAAIVVNDENELYEKTLKLLNDNDFYNNMTKACAKVFKENSGAINFALKIIKELV